ncbi:uncharacterized protein TrAFT101_004859 [Trichoderma asperellum]|uniref:uncharacterized protein n=1 Tax=Trichoderma asperellum TaxID=101201 RepID=UPI00333155E7|nr:hypothetical protein TrAFT101_004859 [Trichoderma asperellum]
MAIQSHWCAKSSSAPGCLAAWIGDRAGTIWSQIIECRTSNGRSEGAEASEGDMHAGEQ